jgi:plastocyanin
MKRLAKVITTIGLVSIVVGCSGNGDDSSDTSVAPDTTSAAPDTSAPVEDGATITISNFQFTGATSVAVGEELTVVNEDSVPHSWTSDDDVFDSGQLGQGENFEFTFEEPGEYTFFCVIHPDAMTGSITVEG